MAAPETPILALDGLGKSFGATRALDGASLSLGPGEILGLVGHNGAGKSTLIKIVAGAYAPDAGSIRIGGRTVSFATPHDAYAAGIRVIHQDAPLVPAFDTVDNCYLGRPYPKRFGTVDRRAMRRSIAAVAAEIAPELPLDRPVAELGVAERQFVRLLKAVSDAGRILILDEPTAALPAEDARRFFDMLRRIQARGTAVVFVSHRLDEVAEICSRAVVLRDGRTVAELAGAELSVRRLIVEMGGETEAPDVRGPVAADAAIVLELRDLVTGRLRHPASLSVRAGEIVALYGLLGSGRSSLLTALWGVEPVLSGEMRLDGQPFAPRGPGDAVGAGISYVPADRHRTGLFANFDLVFNKTLPLLSFYRRWAALPLPHGKAERSDFVIAAERVSMAFRHPTQLAGTLSGGNQQKLIFSRWANRHSRVMLLDEPTEGIDVMAKHAIKEIVRAIAADGNAVLVSTSDREEALELGDRVLVFRDGAIVEDWSRHEASAAALSAAAQAKDSGVPAVAAGLMHHFGRFGTLIAFVLLCLGFSIAAPQAFASQANVFNLLQQLATLSIVATAATLVMTIAEFDLSVGYAASLAAVICFVMFGAGRTPLEAVPLALLAGLVGGAANGVLVAVYGVPSFVATLALGTVLSGLAYGLSGGGSLFQNVPVEFTALGRGAFLGIPVLAFWIVGVLAAASFVLSLTEFGRRLRAIGGNGLAARLAGLPVVRDVILTFALAGALSALAGLLLASRLGSVQPTMGEPLLLPAYAAVFIGTTASPTGSPSIPGTLLGVAITGVLANGMTILGVEPFVQKMLTGAIIIVAVLVRRLGRAR